MKQKIRIVIYSGKEKMCDLETDYITIIENVGLKRTRKLGDFKINIESNGKRRGTIKFWSGMKKFEDFTTD